MTYSRRDFLHHLTGATALSLGTAFTVRAADAASRPPNVIYFMSDELGYYELSCMGNPHFRTPNADRMAAEGIRFTQALAGSSVCAPTRCCLLTGKHAGHTSVRVNGGGTPLREGEVTIASMLKQKGYATGGFGKWGCGGRGSTGVPEEHGFDIFFGYYDQVHAHSYYTPYLIRNSEEVPLKGNKGLSNGETYSHYVIMDEAIKFIRANKDKPFFCYLPVTPPHGLHDIPDSDPSWALYKDKDWPESAKRYAAMVNMVDRNLGQVIALLKELGLDDHTLIFFCGDNGGMDYFRDKQHPRGFHGPNVNPETGKAFRGQKGNLYEGGLRIPMIVRWPGKIPPGRVSDLLWYFPDVMPTVADATGTKPPADTDGISVLPTLLGHPEEQKQHEYLYWEIGSWAAVRMGSWKAVRPSGKAPWELYDLATDIEESNNVAARHPDVLAKMEGFATQAHEPAVEGVFHDRERHERDRRAKFGEKAPESATNAHAFPEKGLIPRKDYRILRVSSEAQSNGKLARNVLDGDPRTHWHTKFTGGPVPPPHELVLDLGGEHTVRGFRYLARQDSGWNGTIKACEFFVSDTPDAFGKPVVKTTLAKVRTPQDVTCDPVKGRYVMLRALSEIDGNPWASASEFGVIGE